MKSAVGFPKFIKIRLKFVIFVLVTLFCVFAMMDDLSHTLCLQLQNEFVKFKKERKISFMRREIDNIYKRIGQRVYLNEDVDSLINELEDYKGKILNMQKEVTVFHKKLKERIVFEKMLKEMSSTNGAIRRKAMRNLIKLDKNKSLPYISMSLFDPDILVRREAAKVINNVIDITLDETKLLIPNFKHVQSILQASRPLIERENGLNTDIEVSTSTTGPDVSITEQSWSNTEEKEKWRE